MHLHVNGYKAAPGVPPCSRNQRIIGPGRKSLLVSPSRRNRCAAHAGPGNSRKCIGHLRSARNRNASSLRRRKQKWPPHDHLSRGLSQTLRTRSGRVVLRAHPRPYGISACSLRMVFLSRTSVRTPLGHSLMSGTCPRMPIWLAPNAGPLKFMPQPRGAVASVYRAASRYHLRGLRHCRDP